MGTQAPGTQLLPVLIQVFAGFSKLDGELIAEDIDSSLGFLRYDYPEAVHSELQRLYQKALQEDQDLNEVAAQLAAQLTVEQKVLLGIQLYLLISRARIPKKQLVLYYRFMTNLGVATEAIDIVYQLNPDDPEDAESEKARPAESRLESLHIGGEEPSDVVFPGLRLDQRFSAFRYGTLVLVKNTGKAPLIVRGRQISGGEFSRIFDGQRVVAGEFVLTFNDFNSYFNAKKGVSSTRLFLAVDAGGSPFVERERTRLSCLEVRFGLRVHVRALDTSQLAISGRPLEKGETAVVSLQDKVVFSDKSEVTFAELQRRARDLGGRFDLRTTKSEYLVSNNPELLQVGDILLSPTTRGELLLRIRCDYDSKSGELEILKADRTIVVDGSPVKERAELRDGETIVLGEGQYLRCYFGERIIEEERNIISHLEVSDVSHYYGKEKALDSISISARRGEMICIIGPSGCGKSSLMRVMAGHLKPKSGKVLMNGLPLYSKAAILQPFISLIPHEDAYDPLLTVEENIMLATRIRSPHLRKAERKKRVDSKLVELGLSERRHRLAGNMEDKTLSGGERKRLNIALDMISVSDVFLFDEPTSGLSSKDSEHVLEIIRSLAFNKIVLVTIHQPSARLFHLFHKALLLDTGGKPVFFGRPVEMLEYFREAYREEILSVQPSADDSVLDQPVETLAPDFIFDVLETPLRDLSGDIIYEEDSRGHYAPARRFTPNFWRDRFQAHRIIEEVKATRIQPEHATDASGSRAAGRAPKPPRRTLRDEATQCIGLFKRAFLSKLRNHWNLTTTLLEAPLLAVLIASVLRYSEDSDYTYLSAFHLPTYLFLNLVCGMFFGLTNSSDDIIRDRVVLQRERNHRPRLTYYILSKLLSLGFFAALQCAIYLLIGNSILEVRGTFSVHFAWMFLTTMTGVITGMAISSIVRDGKTAFNFVPVVLVPQIILGGSLIKYDEMNRDMDLAYTMKQWVKKDADGNPLQDPSKLSVPFICEFMPLRWSYEGAILSQQRLNPWARNLEQLQRDIDRYTDINRSGDLTEAEGKALDDAKIVRALIYGLEDRSPMAVDRLMSSIMDAYHRGTFNSDDFDITSRDENFTAEGIYENKKILLLTDQAEAERTDITTQDNPPNVFFGHRKRFFGIDVSTLWLDFFVLIALGIGGLTVLYVTLRRKLTRV
ncbi:MAG: ABC-type multidrug transport system ATPase subunit [Verrucomicrobiales bacterium]|jgi:ABC-type multidrug transport system ATPase subunit